MTSFRAWFVASCFAWAAVAGALAQDGAKAPNLDALLRAFANMPGLEARFVEEKQISLLAQPLVSRGRIYFTKPGLLLRRVEEPVTSEVLVTPTELRLRDASGTQQIDLAARKELKPFIESLVWVLSGDKKALGSVYDLQFRPQAEGARWQLGLVPKGEPLSRLIARIVITGEGFAVSEIEVQETAGDKSTTRILDANPRRHFDGAERARLFGASPSKKAP